MNVQVEFSLYPLRTTSIREPIRDFIAALENAGLQVQQDTMSSTVSGAADRVFSGLSHGFQDIAHHHQVILLVKISNACPSRNGLRWDKAHE